MGEDAKMIPLLLWEEGLGEEDPPAWVAGNLLS
jgi:hypothetical protein